MIDNDCYQEYKYLFLFCVIRNFVLKNIFIILGINMNDLFKITGMIYELNNGIYMID